MPECIDLESARRRIARPWIAIFCGIASAGAIQSGDAAEVADVLITGGTVYTGADSPPATADVVIIADKIAYVGPNAAERYRARHVVNARDKIVAPGFIDAHTHPESYVSSANRAQRLNAPWLFQGATTLLIGVDGAGTPDVREASEKFEHLGIGTNLVPYVGFGAIRLRVVGEVDRPPAAHELDEMRHLVIKGMCEGAIGLSTGLFYAPQSFARTEEVIALAKEAAQRGGIYDTHQRDESSYSVGLLKSVEEALRIGREAGIPVHFAHIKALGVDTYGQASQVIGEIEAARATGQNVTADQYPWSASQSNLEASLLPKWALDGGRAPLLERIDDPGVLNRIRVDMTDNLRRRGGADSILLIHADTPWTGKTLAQMAEKWDLDPVDVALRIIHTTEHRTDIASFNMIESDIQQFMREPWVVTSSDGSDGHPRQYATFPRKFAKYVVADKIISLNEFIRSSSGRSADVFRLDRRGYLKAGYFADVVVLDPVQYAPRADYVHPRELSAGVQDVWVNGRWAIREGKLTGKSAGRVLLHTPPATTCPP